MPGRAPGGLPHSEIPGSLTASVSPGHFAAWPRPSSAANAKASTMRPSLRSPTSFPSSTCRGLGSRPARARGTIPPARPLAADPRRLWIAPDAVLRRPVSQGGSGRGEGKNRGRCLLFLRLSVAFNAVRAGDPPRARSPHRSGCGEEFEARDVRAGLACLPRPQNPTGSAWRVVKVREREEPSRQGGSPL